VSETAFNGTLISDTVLKLWLSKTFRSLDLGDRFRQTKVFDSPSIAVNQTDEPVQACPPSAMYRFRKFARRNKAAVHPVCGLAV
jgi:eukaryotic-like serine/threonine-protein kinase